MKVYLMHGDRDFDFEQALPLNQHELRQDLELDTLLKAMSAGDGLLFELAKTAVLSNLTDPEANVYRQQVLGDCLEHPTIVRAIHDVAVDALEARRKAFLGYRGASPGTILHGAVQILELLVDALKRLRQIADEHAGEFRSEGFERFFAMLAAELDDEYFATIDDHLRRLKFRDGVLISARLGKGSKGIDYTAPETQAGEEKLARTHPLREGLRRVQVPDRRSRRGPRQSPLGVQSEGHQPGCQRARPVDRHILSFFGVLRSEVGFYIACLNLYERLAAKGQPVCFPAPAVASEAALSAGGLYDVCLSLSVDTAVVGNDLSADDKSLVVDHRRERGREVDLPARHWTGPADDAVRHVRRRRVLPRQRLQRDLHTLQARGRPDHEERQARRGAGPDERDRRPHRAALHPALQRVVRVDQRERRLRDRAANRPGVARPVHQGRLRHPSVRAGRRLPPRADRRRALLRAERKPDGRRTFRLIEGEPLPTSYGKDLYERIFATSVRRTSAPPFS